MNKPKRLLSLLLCLTLLFGALGADCLAASKEAGKTGGSCGKSAKWSYNEKTNTLSITGKGKVTDGWSKTLGRRAVKVVVRNGITTIGRGAFARTRIEKLALPQSLTAIESYAFGGTKAALPSSVTIPKNVSRIGNYAFSACKGLKAIRVQKGNRRFVSVGGALYNRDKTALLAFPASKGGNYRIPKGVKVLRSGALRGCSLGELRIPTSVRKLQPGAVDNAKCVLYFMGHAPAGLVEELSDEEVCRVSKVYYPRDFTEEWSRVMKQVVPANYDIRWFHWWETIVVVEE